MNKFFGSGFNSRRLHQNSAQSQQKFKKGSEFMLVIVVIVLGIIVAGGFLLYFLGDILMSMSKKKNRDGQIIKQKQEAEAKKLEERVNALEILKQ